LGFDFGYRNHQKASKFYFTINPADCFHDVAFSEDNSLGGLTSFKLEKHERTIWPLNWESGTSQSVSRFSFRLQGNFSIEKF